VQTRAHGGLHQRVVGRVELDLVNATAESVVAVQLWRRTVGQPGMVLHVGAATQGAQRRQWCRIQIRCVQAQCVLQPPVAVEQVVVGQRRGLIENVVCAHAAPPNGAGRDA
jgi:hypothetical protein